MPRSLHSPTHLLVLALVRVRLQPTRTRRPLLARARLRGRGQLVHHGLPSEYVGAAKRCDARSRAR
jgi:hypothetical protein